MARPRLSDEQLTAILDDAAKVIAERRSDNTRLSDIARVAGVSVGTLQHYFGSREELLVAVFGRVNALSMNRCAELTEEDELFTRLRELIEAMVGAGPDWLLWTEIWATETRSAAVREGTAEQDGSWQRLIIDVIEHGVREGAFRIESSPERLAREMTAFADGLGIQMLLGRLAQLDAREMMSRFATERLGLLVESLR